jgi:hypothetical protein
LKKYTNDEKLKSTWHTCRNFLMHCCNFITLKEKLQDEDATEKPPQP